MIIYLNLPRMLYPRCQQDHLYHPRLEELIFPQQPLVKKLAQQGLLVTLLEGESCLNDLQEKRLQQWLHCGYQHHRQGHVDKKNNESHGEEKNEKYVQKKNSGKKFIRERTRHCGGVERVKVENGTERLFRNLRQLRYPQRNYKNLSRLVALVKFMLCYYGGIYFSIASNECTFTYLRCIHCVKELNDQSRLE